MIFAVLHDMASIRVGACSRPHLGAYHRHSLNSSGYRARALQMPQDDQRLGDEYNSRGRQLASNNVGPMFAIIERPGQTNNRIMLGAR